jgi:hypothetical protein
MANECVQIKGIKNLLFSSEDSGQTISAGICPIPLYMLFSRDE